MKRLIFLTVLIFLSCFIVKADYLKITRKASVKATPERNSPVITKLEQGEYVYLLDNGIQENGYYHIQLKGLNQTGWVYRTYVRGYTGDIPYIEEDDFKEDPLRDKTLYLTDQQKTFAQRHLRIGKPQAIYERVYEGYVFAQDARLKIPLWVQYELSRKDLEGRVKRKDDFRPDYSIPYGSRSELLDYSGSGYDRGHMAPAADMKRSAKVMNESFLLSNMSPQVGIDFNRGIWADLESLVRDWVKQKGTLAIITGPVFKSQNETVIYQVIGDNKVAVPTHFYKIVIKADDFSNVEAIAFLLPNNAIQDKKLENFIVSIDFIEKLTGLNFLSEIPAYIQDNIECKISENLW